MESLFRDAKRDLDFKVVDADDEEIEETEENQTSHIQKIAMKIKGMEG